MDEEDEAGDPASQRWNTWLVRIAWGVVGGLVFICLLAAARQVAPSNNRLWYDLVLDGLFPLLGAAFILRWIVSVPFRFFELLAGVVAAAAIGARTYTFWHAAYEIRAGEQPTAAQLAMCLLMADIVLAGLAIGLRHCARLNVEAAWKRLLIVLFGITQGPALIYFCGLPLFLSSIDIRTWTDYSLWWAGALWFAAAGILAINAWLAVKALQLNSEGV